MSGVAALFPGTAGPAAKGVCLSPDLTRRPVLLGDRRRCLRNSHRRIAVEDRLEVFHEKQIHLARVQDSRSNSMFVHHGCTNQGVRTAFPTAFVCKPKRFPGHLPPAKDSLLRGKNAGISLFLGLKEHRTFLRMILIPLDLLVWRR